MYEKRSFVMRIRYAKRRGSIDFRGLHSAARRGRPLTSLSLAMATSTIPQNQSSTRNAAIGRAVLEVVLPLYFQAASRLIPATVERQALALFSTPGSRRKHRPDAIGTAIPLPFEVPLGSERLRAWSYGAGQTVLLVHGWGGCAGDWTPLVAALVAKGFHPVVLDLPAHGLSTGKRTNLVHAVEAVKAVAAHAEARLPGGAPLHALVGHSFGGAAAAIAVREGVPVSRLVLVSPVAYPLTFLDVFTAALRLPAARHRGVLNRIAEIAGGDLSRLDIAHAARELALPGLVVHDRSDLRVRFEEGETIARNWRGSLFMETEGLGHRGVLASPEVHRRIVAFLQSPDAPVPVPG